MNSKSKLILYATTLGSSILAGSGLAQETWTGHAITPVANPVFFESPLIQNEVRPIFAWHRLDKDFLGVDANVRLYALQLRYAINDRLAIIATKDGYIEFDPEGVPGHSGWADIAAGIKYALYRNDDKQAMITPGFTFEIPTGNERVFQGNGKGEANVFVSATKGYGDLHLTANLGGRIPVDWDAETASIRYCGMIDYYICRWFIPFATINAFTTLSEGNAMPFNSEGFDLINFGSQNAGGRTQAAWGVGFRSRLHHALDFGFAYERGFTPTDDIFYDRFTFDFSWRY